MRSLKFRVFLLVTLAGVFPCIVLSEIILDSYESRAVSVRTSTVRNQCAVLANHLQNYGYMADTSIDIVNAELDQLSNLYNGRVLIMNADYRIIKDTYGISEGKYMISEDVVKSFSKESISRYDGENRYIEVTTPIVFNESVLGVMLTSVSAEEIHETIQILRRRALLIIIIAVILIVAHAFLAARGLAKPFVGISNAISDYHEGYDHPEIFVNDYYETERITNAFNEMLGRMRVLDDSRQAFVSNVSHELKTPITSVKVLADSLLTQEDVPAEVYRDFMEDIVHEIDRENDIINDLLALVRMDKKGATLNPEECDIEELVVSIIRRLKPLADMNGIELLFQSIRSVTAEVDKTKLSLAITNLIENAIKYNVENGKVEVTLDAEPMMFSLTVADTGVGIPEEDIDNIFERFYRVDKSHSKEIEGNGLGLSITRNAILMHKGAIKVESVVGEGSIFTVKIPISYIVE